MSQTAVHYSVSHVVEQLREVLNVLDATEYTKPCISLSGASLGQHTRHIIDMFSKLEMGYQAGVVNYDQRDRDATIETDPDFALMKMVKLVSTLPQDDVRLRIQSQHSTGDVFLDSTAYREILYCLEHCIHHMALIKVGLLELGIANIPENFGVAYSTIAYKQQAAR
jgi:hypothetical protein